LDQKIIKGKKQSGCFKAEENVKNFDEKFAFSVSGFLILPLVLMNMEVGIGDIEG